MGSIMSIELNRDQQKGQPLYEQIRSQVESSIINEKLEVGDRLPSLYFIAKQLQVNYRTVKAAFNLLEKGGMIKYLPNSGAVVANKGSKIDRVSNKKFSLSLVRFHTDGFWVSVSEGARRFAGENELDYTTIDTGYSHDRYIEAINSSSQISDGLLIIPFDNREYRRAIQNAIKAGSKIVLIDRNVRDMEASSVNADHFLGGYQATTHLLATHKRPVYYLGWSDQPSSCSQRVRGWRQAMLEYNFHKLDQYIIDIPTATEAEVLTTADNGLEYNIKAASRLFDTRKEEVYSIFTCNDNVAHGVYAVAEKRGLKIGRDVYLASFGDTPICERFPVPLTSVCQYNEKVGYEGAKLLYAYLSENHNARSNILIPTDLQVRQSSTG